MLKYENKNFHNKKKEVVTMKLELKLRKNKKKERQKAKKERRDLKCITLTTHVQENVHMAHSYN